MCGLDECQYNSGMIQVQPFGNSRWQILADTLKTRAKEVKTVHANFLVGNEKKRDAFSKNDLWLTPHHTPHPAELACGKCKNSMC
jgi:hypothetical protein